MFGFLQRLPSCSAYGARLLLALVFCSVLLFDGVSFAVLEVEPSEVLIRIPEQQERQEQQLNGSSSSEVVREALFSCLQVESDESRHRPRSEVIWMKDGQVIITQGNRKYRNYGKKKRLLINNTNVGDSGIYECALTPNATEKGRAELWIVPEVLSAPTPQILQGGPKEGGDVGVVECQVSLGTQYIEWWRDSVLLAMLNLTYDWTGGEAGGHDTKSPQANSRYSILHNGSLVISSVSSSDAGLYSCVAANKAGQKGREIQVVVNGSDVDKEPTHQETTPPSVDTNLTDKNSSNSVSNRNCVEYYDFTFGPNPKLRDLRPPPSIESPAGGGGEEARPPFFTSLSPSCVQSLVGYRVILNCSAGGYPSPNVTWERDGEILWTQHYHHNMLETYITHQPRYLQLPDGSLLINPVQVEDRGVYVCRAANEVGEVTEEVRLRVRKMDEVCGMRDGSNVDKMDDGSGESGEEKNHFQRKKRIVYGEAVDGIHEWPWQVLIQYAGNDLLCGGTLIRPDYVLTAAHCLHSNMYDGYMKVEESDLIVKVGVYNRSKTEPHQQLLKVRSYAWHTKYLTTSKDNDIALLKLMHPVKLTPHVGIACLPSQSAEPLEGTLCTITGWGHLQFNAGWSPEVLHTAQVPLISYSSCRNAITSGSRVTRNMICAGWAQGGPDACQNDSGGPLVCPIPDSPERWALYGVVNFGTGCGLPNEYGVYARVTKHIRWINQQMT